MTSKSVTIRIPETVLEMVQSFPDGETRTDKIINMLVLACECSETRKSNVRQSQDSDLQSVIQRITYLEDAVRQLQDNVLQSTPSVSGDNRQRAEETLNNIQAIISAMSDDDKDRILKARYPKSSFRKFSNEAISKDSVAKYWDLIKSQLIR